ncbi:DNA cytosine methyltransferase [Adlercreutzia sp. ZJ242]|uniref:DNA cytosine methyltransferase n=1 Tax=Adlercreutzia sp. ZJ242 TaxID=2709409 RepID=UPI0013EB010B|nr:DNA cytosine methyltransferase [Adlercreutzia sp. ZJ242]
MKVQQDDKYSILSFFSGAGFLDLGFEHSGFSISFVNEWHEPFMRVYQYSRAKMGMDTPRFGYSCDDVNSYIGGAGTIGTMVDELRAEGRLVGFIGGPPCPDFSVGGKNRGRNGDNGKLSQSYVTLIIENRPDFFLFENVKGLWRTARHREFYEELKHSLHQAGYATTERLTNALEFGAPQDRDRILLFGLRKDFLPVHACDGDALLGFPWSSHITEDLEAIKNLPWPERNAFSNGSIRPMPSEITGHEALTVQYWFKKNDVEHHPNSSRYFVPRQGLTRMKTVGEGDVSKKSYKRLHRWRYSPTVAYGNNEVHLHPYRERRLSVSEALSLQSLPAEYELPNDITLTDSFKTIGNGVPYLLAKGVATTIHEYLDVTIDVNAIEATHKSD